MYLISTVKATLNTLFIPYRLWKRIAKSIGDIGALYTCNHLELKGEASNF